MHIGFWWESQKRPLRPPRHRREDNIKMDLREGVVWTGLIWLSSMELVYSIILTAHTA
jgi:hypothetical protein